jgi:pimeloyl-ACP methyl ester carboxylesterase
MTCRERQGWAMGALKCETASMSRWPLEGRLFAAVVKHWRLARPDVVAHDFGGYTALRAHLLHGCGIARSA